MSDQPASGTTTKVAERYEEFPYPARDPELERGRLLRTALDDLAAVNFHCHGGRRPFEKGLRALVAGGGTGDAIIYLAHQLRHTPSELVYIDLSQASLEVARERARVRGLAERVTWIQGSLLDLPGMGLAPFDYINCSGVLHHLDDPEAGLRALLAVLADDGAMGLMLYGQYGRTGVYQVQDLLRLVNQSATSMAECVENAQAVIRDAPPTNWFKRGWGSRPVRYELPDVELVDMFLHPRDQAFTVPGLYRLLDRVGLELVDYTADQRLFYDLGFVVQNPRLREAVKSLPLRDQQAAAELYHGIIGMHTFWVSRQGPRRADPSDPDQVPFFSHSAREHGLTEIIVSAGGRPWTLKLGPEGSPQIALTVRPDPLGQRFLESIDDQRTLSQIATAIVEGTDPRPSSEAVYDSIERVLRQMMTCDLVLLRHRSVAPLPQEHAAP